MRQTLKIGFVVLVVAALATSGIALAQTDDETTGEPDHTSFIMERLSPLVEDGTLTQAQAEAVAGVLADGVGPRRPGRHGPGPEAVGEFLGMTADELRAALEDGSTLAEIAEANGSSAQALIDHLVAEAETRLDEAVADGRIDQDQKDERLAEITERVTDMVNGEAPAFGPGRHGDHRPGGRGGFGPGEARPDGDGTGI